MPKITADAQAIAGLRQFKNELKQIGDDLPKDLRAGLKGIAEDVASDARSSFESGPGVDPLIAPSVKATAQSDSAFVQLGGNKFPAALGAEFGSMQFKQFQPWRGSGGDAGYHLYPEFRKHREHLPETVGDLLDQLTAKAFPE